MLGIYSTKCETCNESSKCQVKMHKYRDEVGKTYQGYMYECQNLNCEVQRTVKRKIPKCHEMDLKIENKRPKRRYKSREYDYDQ